MLILVLILLVLALILVAIIRYDIHPFLALFGGAIVYGLAARMETDSILKSITEGFGGVMGNVGLLILFGVILGTFLEKNRWSHGDCRKSTLLGGGKIHQPFVDA